jgi:pimeloyl-ACP methyl ester carboxylesterase
VDAKKLPLAARGSVTSADGTVIGYRWLGRGPGVVLVHGNLMASQNFTKLGAALADRFTVYIPDRRGRGMSGPFGPGHTVHKEVEDLQALLRHTDAKNVFGLSSGAVISLEAARHLSEIHKLALYEPPLSFHDSRSTDWVPRYERENADGDLASAFVTIAKGTMGSALIDAIPRFLLVPLARLALAADAKKTMKNGEVAMRGLVPTAHYDAAIIIQLADSLESFRAVSAKVLLLRGARSPRYLHTAFDRLAATLPDARCVELPSVGHLAADNGGKPLLVADELRRFFDARARRAVS